MLIPVGLLASIATAAAALGGETPRDDGIASWVAYGIYPLFLVWGVALAGAVWAFQYRTRRRCRVCGRV
jgi:hypothetical protein